MSRSVGYKLYNYFKCPDLVSFHRLFVSENDALCSSSRLLFFRILWATFFRWKVSEGMLKMPKYDHNNNDDNNNSNDNNNDDNNNNNSNDNNNDDNNGETRIFAWPLCSVTRFGEISSFWQNFTSLLQIFDSLFLIWQNIEPILANLLHCWGNFHCCKWPNIEILFNHLVTLPPWAKYLLLMLLLLLLYCSRLPTS